ncbi:MAG TPA: 50S ribosomal protein L23 [Phycisphaerae bacterium]|nr:50S ribosomal protein L23 [Phycisphaerae bacterium]
MDPYQVVIKPLITEKGTIQNETVNQYAFQVHRRANKQQIREAVAQIYEVRVLKVRTLKRRGKVRRYRYTRGRTAGMKKAVVTLHPDDHIDLF